MRFKRQAELFQRDDGGQAFDVALRIGAPTRGRSCRCDQP
jgi:hypothetical protein